MRVEQVCLLTPETVEEEAKLRSLNLPYYNSIRPISEATGGRYYPHTFKATPEQYINLTSTLPEEETQHGS